MCLAGPLPARPLLCCFLLPALHPAHLCSELITPPTPRADRALEMFMSWIKWQAVSWRVSRQAGGSRSELERLVASWRVSRRAGGLLLVLNSEQ